MRIGKTLVAIAAIMSGGGAFAHGDVPKLLPVGDGKVTSYPKAGNVFSCTTRFRDHAGAFAKGDWFHGDMWNPLEKPTVSGSKLWPSAYFDIRAEGNLLRIKGNGLPVGQPTGTFPISRSEVAYRYDRNPNSIKTQDLDFTIPMRPEKAVSPSCLSMGMIGFSNSGVAIYNALDAGGRDAAAHEIQDKCNGHPQQQGQYHYHSSSPCMAGADGNEAVGWALDGYPILGMRDGEGALVTNDDLDACHGRAEEVVVDGRRYDYAYRLTMEYPYTLGCYTGVVPHATRRAAMQMLGPPPGQGGERGQKRRPLPF